MDARLLTKMLITSMIIFVACVITMFSIRAHSQEKSPRCVTIGKDIEGLKTTLEGMKAVGKFWLWRDDGYAVSFVVSTIYPKLVIITFYNEIGCRSVHPRTFAVRTQVAITDKIKSFIAKSELLWKNTDKVFLTKTGRGL